MKFYTQFLNNMLMQEADDGTGTGGSGGGSGVSIEEFNKLQESFSKLQSDYEKTVESRDAVDGKNKQLRNEMKKKNEKYAIFEDEETIKTLKNGGIQALKSQFQEELKGQYDKEYKETFEKYQREVQESQEKLTKQETAYNDLRINLEVNKAINELSDKMQPNTSEFLKPIVEQTFVFNEKGVLVHKDGKRNNDGEPMTPKDLFESRELVEKYPFLYKGKSGTGGNPGGNAGFNGAKMSSEQVQAHLKSVPATERAAEFKNLQEKGLI